MLALLPYPNSLCIWSNTSSLQKSTNVQLGRNACNAVFQAHVRSAVTRLHTVNLSRSYGGSTAGPFLSRVCVPVHGWVSLVLVLAAVCRSQDSVTSLVWHDVRKDPSYFPASVPEHEALQRLPIIQRFPS